MLAGGPLHDLRQWLGSGHAIEQHLQADAQRQLGQLVAELQARRRIAIQPAHANGAAPDKIARAADAQGAALLVLGARGAGFMRCLLLGSTAERLLRRTARPVLVVRQTPHAPYRRALVALDFSAWSAQAITLARQVAPHARLLLFHAFEVPFEEKLQFAGVDAATIDRYRQQARADASHRLQAQAHDCGLRPGDWEPCIVEGDASLRIIACEQDKDCDLVVLGKQGRSATEDLLLGSVSRHVLAEGSTDVLVSTARNP